MQKATAHLRKSGLVLRLNQLAGPFMSGKRLWFVYFLVSTVSDMVRIGSTFGDRLVQRLSHYKHDSVIGYAPVSAWVRRVGCEMLRIIPMVALVCDEETIRKKEQEFMERYGVELNVIAAHRTPEERERYRKEKNRRFYLDRTDKVANRERVGAYYRDTEGMFWRGCSGRFPVIVVRLLLGVTYLGTEGLRSTLIGRWTWTRDFVLPTLGLGKTMSYPRFIGKRSMATLVARIAAVLATNSLTPIGTS